MSAAEKLKGMEPVILTVRAGEESKGYPVGEKTLYEIPLPQIVAVVEAAEREIEYDCINGVGHYELAERTGRDIGRALAALDEALS